MEKASQPFDSDAPGSAPDTSQSSVPESTAKSAYPSEVQAEAPAQDVPPAAAAPFSNPAATGQPAWERPKKAFNPKRTVKCAVAVILVLLIGFVWLSLKQAGNYTTIEAKGPTFSYALTFAGDAQQASLDGNSLLKGKALDSSTGVLVTVGPAVQSKEDCFSGAGSTVTVVSDGLINGERHNLCYSSSLNTYDANFRNKGAWYFISVRPQDGTSQVSAKTASTIIDSIKIN